MFDFNSLSTLYLFLFCQLYRVSCMFARNSNHVANDQEIRIQTQGKGKWGYRCLEHPISTRREEKRKHFLLETKVSSESVIRKSGWVYLSCANPKPRKEKTEEDQLLTISSTPQKLLIHGHRRPVHMFQTPVQTLGVLFFFRALARTTKRRAHGTRLHR